ncbi:hypothetical protein [Endozoicomonas sp. Mp262]|uniref:hypothetical protein n=1 Tax=Endozoicomonas sp. Mp262 TaxID=2919499 RepID=UPI0021D862BD
MSKIFVIFFSCFFALWVHSGNAGKLALSDDAETELEVKDMRSANLPFCYYRVEAYAELFPDEEVTFKYFPVAKRKNINPDDPQLEKVVALFQFKEINFGVTVSQNNDAHNSDMENNVPNGEFYPFAHDFQRYLVKDDEFYNISSSMVVNPWSPFFIRFMRFFLEQIKDVRYLAKQYFLQKLKVLKDGNDQPYWVREIQWEKERDGNESDNENWIESGSLFEYFDLAKIVPEVVDGINVRQNLCVCEVDRKCRNEKVMADFYPTEEMIPIVGHLRQYMTVDKTGNVNYYLSDIDTCYQLANAKLEQEYIWVKDNIISTLEEVSNMGDDILLGLLYPSSGSDVSYRAKLDQPNMFGTPAGNKRKREPEGDQEPIMGLSGDKRRKFIHTSSVSQVKSSSRSSSSKNRKRRGRR